MGGDVWAADLRVTIQLSFLSFVVCCPGEKLSPGGVGPTGLVQDSP